MNDIYPVLMQFPYPALFLLLILGGVGLPFPEDTTLILCGFLISHDIVRVIPSVTVVYAGALSADLLIYAAGRRYGRSILSSRRFSRLVTAERLAALEDRFRRQGVLFILGGRHLIGLRAQVFLVAGVMKMPLLTFAIADGISLTATVALMVGAGYLGGNSLQIIRHDVSRIEHVLVVIGVLFLAGYLTLRYVRSRRK